MNQDMWTKGLSYYAATETSVLQANISRLGGSTCTLRRIMKSVEPFTD